MLCGDGLMSHQPLIEVIKDNRMHDILVCKPGDHKYLYEWLNDFPELPTFEVKDKQERIHRYRWKNDVPLHGQANAIKVNFFEYTISNKQGKTTTIHSGVADIVLTQDNVVKMTKAGRCRWKIENECFNTLKNRGYYIEHNYGHGQRHLSFNMYLLTLLAFYFHLVFELTDGLYQACRQKLGSKRNLWEKLLDFLLHRGDSPKYYTKKS